ncbi:ciliated left-right organizer ZP-N domains-containing protein isoform X1 [Arvicanthis niloticus]|uniref:ciliated left-right organizer ZP-N domains-containing protein isoform X1 n=1 Tax=Arvicanthis niloticus TaxID=61156 RepID=UPI00402BAE33
MDSPVHWTVENFFQCVGSREESLVSTVTPRTTLPTLSPGWETTLAETPSAASSRLQTPQMAALEEPLRHFVHQPAKESTEQELAVAFMEITSPARGSWESSPSSTAMQEHQAPQIPPEKADLSPHAQTPATLFSDHTEVFQADPGPSHSVFLAPSSLSTHLSSEIPSSPWPSWPSDGAQTLLSSEPSVTPTDLPRATGAEQDTVQPSGSPFTPGDLSNETVSSTESMEPFLREPAHISEEFPPLTRPFMSSLAEEGLIFHHHPKKPQERLIIKAKKPLQNDHDPSGEETRGYLDLSTSEPSQEMTGLGTDATFTTSRRRQPDARAYLGPSSPELTGRHRVGPAALQTILPKGLLASTPEKPAAPSEGGVDRTLQRESAPLWPAGWHDLGAAHTASPLPSHTQSLLAPTEAIFPPSGEPGNTLPGGQESMESRLAPSTDNHQPPEL